MSEELIQRGYLSKDGKVKGEDFGLYEKFTLGNTTLLELKRRKVVRQFASNIIFDFKEFSSEKLPQSKPDELITARNSKGREVILVVEYKKPAKLKKSSEILYAQEQCIYYAAALAAPLGYVTDGTQSFWLDIPKSLQDNQPAIINANKTLTPENLEEILRGEDEVRDPSALVETIWQIIWHATKAEPKDCLLTFVEVFIYKFISDNVKDSLFPRDYKAGSLLVDVEEFKLTKGVTQIEYYAQIIRPKIKNLFPEHTTISDPVIENVYGFKSITSRTSVINGFAFLSTGEEGIDVFNQTFLQILWLFQDFGPLTRIDPEFKSRLYEKFLKRSIKHAKLGQFFTPRNLIRAIVKMADLGSLPDNATVLDPACGVGGFVLEPILHKHSLFKNYRLENRHYSRRINLIGSDVDLSTHVLAKANMLIHLVEEVRRLDADIEAINNIHNK